MSIIHVSAITIRQPWATLLMLGVKSHETRTWNTKRRGKIAIHASKTVDSHALHESVIRETLERYGYSKLEDFPVGCVLGVGNLEDVIESVDYNTQGYILENGEIIGAPEYFFGDFTPGRYAWQISDIQSFSKPIPPQGRLGIWTFNYDDEGGTAE